MGILPLRDQYAADSNSIRIDPELYSKSDRPRVTDPTAVSIRNVKKHFGDFVALSDITLDITDNEFFTLLGPSGCGKTTLLRMIAGFESTTAGEIWLYGDEIESLPPNKRTVNTVFQSYALFPHMNVAQNIGFGLKMLGWPERELKARVDEMVQTVKLQEFVHRKPAQLSGGQQQRVALARAIAPKPKVLLLDEPLSALDLKLRQQMRAELKSLQRETGITFIFVTHDQEEALTMSDRIAVMSSGELQQTGTPVEVYEKPVNRFVADFIGETNLLSATVTSVTGDTVQCALASGEIIVAETDSSNNMPAAGTEGLVSLRPERLTIHTDATSNPNTIKGTLTGTTYTGTDTQYEVQLKDGTSIAIRLQNNADHNTGLTPGQSVELSAADESARFLVN